MINHSIIERLDSECRQKNAQWIAVTKLRSVDTLIELYTSGKKVFGENKAQEICQKYEQLPKDIVWHFIGHLQTNKVKQIVDKVDFIHSIDSENLLNEVQKQASKINRKINCFIQIHVAKEETKYGFTPIEAVQFFKEYRAENFPNINIIGLMAMASFTENKDQIRAEFSEIKATMTQINHETNHHLSELSMGMSGDYEIALDCGATYLRIGSVLYS